MTDTPTAKELFLALWQAKMSIATQPDDATREDGDDDCRDNYETGTGFDSLWRYLWFDCKRLAALLQQG